MGNHLTDVEFGQILALRNEGYTIKKIHEKTSIPMTTIYESLVRFKKRKDFIRKKGSGRPNKLTYQNKAHLEKILEKQPKLSAPKLNKEFENKTRIAVSDNTVRNELKKSGFIASRTISKPLLTKKHKISRFGICEEWAILPDSFWEDVIFSDESKFNLHNPDGNFHIWKNPKKSSSSSNFKQTEKYGGGSVLAWGCISARGVGRLVFIDEIMDKYLYLSIISNNVVQSAEEMGLKNFLFQQDRDPKHTANIVTRFFEQNDIGLLRFPSKSPDLNPIEHIWALIKKKLHGKSFKKKEHLKKEIEKIWSQISKETVSKLIKTMPRRIREVLRAKGGHSSY